MKVLFFFIISLLAGCWLADSEMINHAKMAARDGIFLSYSLFLVFAVSINNLRFSLFLASLVVGLVFPMYCLFQMTEALYIVDEFMMLTLVGLTILGVWGLLAGMVRGGSVSRVGQAPNSILPIDPVV